MVNFHLLILGFQALLQILIDSSIFPHSYVSVHKQSYYLQVITISFLPFNLHAVVPLTLLHGLEARTSSMCLMAVLREDPSSYDSAYTGSLVPSPCTSPGGEAVCTSLGMQTCSLGRMQRTTPGL